MRIDHLFTDTVVGCDVITAARKDFVRQYKGVSGIYLSSGQGLVLNEEIQDRKDGQNTKKSKNKPSLIALLYHWLTSSFDLAKQNLFVLSDQVNSADNQLFSGVILSGLIMPTGSRLNSSNNEVSTTYSGDLCLSKDSLISKLPFLADHLRNHLQGNDALVVVLDIEDNNLVEEVKNAFVDIDISLLSVDDLNAQIQALPNKIKNACVLRPVKGIVPFKPIVLTIIALIVLYFGYNYYQSKQLAQQRAQEEAQKNQYINQKKKIAAIQSEQNFYQQLDVLNAYRVLSSILSSLPRLTYLENGWQLASVEFKDDSLQLWLTYQRKDYGSMHGLLAFYKKMHSPSLLVTDQNANQAKFSVVLSLDNDGSVMNRQLFTNNTLRLADKNSALDKLQQYGLKYQIQSLDKLNNSSLNAIVGNILAQSEKDNKGQKDNNKKKPSIFEQLNVTGDSSIALLQLLDVLSQTQFTTIQTLSIQFDTKQISVINNFQFKGVSYA